MSHSIKIGDKVKFNKIGKEQLMNLPKGMCPDFNRNYTIEKLTVINGAHSSWSGVILKGRRSEYAASFFDVVNK